jgi:hypothetical protein
MGGGGGNFTITFSAFGAMKDRSVRPLLVPGPLITIVLFTLLHIHALPKRT